MALNITFDGYVYDKNSVIGDSSINYQAFFYNNGTSSSSSKWNDTRVLENTGYYNINLGDTDWLGQEGLALPASIVVIVFWKGNIDRTASCENLLEWGAFEIVLNGSDFYGNNAQIKDNILPDLVWGHNLPENPVVDSNYTVNNYSSDEHSWVFSGTTMNHWYTRYGQIINGPNFIDYTNIYWGDGESGLFISGAGGASHVWESSGTYEILIEVYDDCGAFTSDTEIIDIYYNEPVPNIDMIPSDPDPNELVYFEYSGSDVNNRVISIDWFIEDDGVYGTTNTSVNSGRDETVAHTEGKGTYWYGQSSNDGAFTNPGIHNVSIDIHWNDGFSDQVTSYSKNFTQNLFSGPSLSFYQDPAKAVVGSGISFVNDSTNVNRVGLGLPNHEEYEWVWYDESIEENELDKDYSYVFSKVPNSAECRVKLCASWSDGWETNETCITEDLIFGTYIDLILIDCYYNLDIIGTSSNGTVSAYSWTVSSGIDSDGPWEEVWSSPVDIKQKEKSICFTRKGWYKIEGFVYGTGATTSDDEVLFINEVCADSGSFLNIWNGTGPLDSGADWKHEGFGVESPAAVYEGTNGLLVTDSLAGKNIKFHSYSYEDVEVNNYDFLSFWINLKEWEYGKDVFINLYSNNDYDNLQNIKLSNYLKPRVFNIWQKVMIPLKRFHIKANRSMVGWPMFVNTLDFNIEGQIDFWLDNIILIVGRLETLPVCSPDMETYQSGESTLSHPDMETYQVGPSPSPPMSGIQHIGIPYPRPKNL